MPAFVTRQCSGDACRLRFPVAADSRLGDRCPHCGADTIVDVAYDSHDARDTGAESTAGGQLEVLLDNVRSLRNVGSMFRTADGAGVAHMHLCGFTPTPAHPQMAKTALGAEAAVPWTLHRDGAAALCPSVKVTIVDGRDGDVRRNIWAGADIFTLPVDSIQETFGLVPVEAMAAGLPVVMPDWNGFRDTVRHGETGYLVPTRMAPQGTGQDLARRYAEETDDYLQYLALVQSQVQLDVSAYRTAFLALMDQGVRARMGAAGKAHVRERFDWRAVIPQYLDLARELEAVRRTSLPTTPPLESGTPNPFEVDPFALYESYPTEPLRPGTRVEPGRPANKAVIEEYDRFSGRFLYGRRLMRPKEALVVHAEVVRTGGATVSDLARVLGRRMDFVLSAVLYLAKADLVRLPEIGPRLPG